MRETDRQTENNRDPPPKKHATREKDKERDEQKLREKETESQTS